MGVREKGMIIVAAGLALAACNTTTPRQGALAEPAIEPLADGVFMIPVNRDQAGCVRYRLISARRPGDTRVYWRIGSGEFTDNRAEADCSPRTAKP